MTRYKTYDVIRRCVMAILLVNDGHAINNKQQQRQSDWGKEEKNLKQRHRPYEEKAGGGRGSADKYSVSVR